MSEQVIIHKHFELGQAPYSYLGLWVAPSKTILEANPDVYNRALAERPKCCNFSCDHCGTAITNHCVIQDATGKKFAIGCDCVKKLHAVERLSQLDADKKAHQRQLSRARAEKKREAERAKREAELDRQKVANGGLTNWEVAHEAEQQARRERELVFIQQGEFFIKHLNADGSNFASSLAKSISRGDIPRGRGEDILIDIVTKSVSGSSRVNTKAFNAALPDVIRELDTLKENFKS